MKLSIVVAGVVLALLQHQGVGAQECDCTCTCPVTASTCSDDISTTTTPAPTTTTTTPAPADIEYDCGSHTIKPNRKSIFTSKNYPDDYKKSTDCEWEFTCSNSDGLIYITCTVFKTEDGSNCKKQDYAKISDGQGTLGTYCGKNNNLEHTTRDNYLKFAFTTDGDKNVEKGFTCYALCTAYYKFRRDMIKSEEIKV